MSKKKYTFIDLFAGCGGLSEGFYKAGYKALAHVEIDPTCCETQRMRMRYYGYSENEIRKSVIEQDITSEKVTTQLEKAVGKANVDIIIGGPPCQAYSTSGRARDEHGMQEDPRNFLFEHYVKILNHFKPRMFVFENVTGLLTAHVGEKKILPLVFRDLGENYDLLPSPSKMVFNTVEFGVPQVRKRVIIIGVRRNAAINISDVYAAIKATHYTPEEIVANRRRYVTVREAIGDLPAILMGERNSDRPFTYEQDANDFINWIKGDGHLYDHITRTQNDTDTERYQEMARNHWTFSELKEFRSDLNHPKARVFSNSYAVQFWDMPARTIIAHLGKDGNQFIHPDAEQGRSISVREAARLQSFPDDFRFAGSMSAQFKQIGNAVPPLFAYVIAKSIKKFL